MSSVSSSPYTGVSDHENEPSWVTYIASSTAISVAAYQIYLNSLRKVDLDKSQALEFLLAQLGEMYDCQHLCLYLGKHFVPG